jgi:CRP-like cAMP-binding protein
MPKRTVDPRQSKGTAVLFTHHTYGPLGSVPEIPLFAECTTRDRRRIDTLSTAVTRPAGRVLCHLGEIGRECFVLVDGHVDVETKHRHYTLGPGEMFGEIALLVPNGRRTATIIARDDITTLAFSRTEFTQLMTAVPTVAHKVLEQAAHRLLEDLEELPA